LKKILFIAPNLQKGGMEQQLIQLIENIPIKEYEIELALFRNKIEFTIPSNLKIINLAKKGKFDLFFIIRFFLLIYNGKYHVLHSKISGPNEYVMLIAGLLRRNNIIIELRSSGLLLYKDYKKMKLLFTIFQSYRWKIICNSKKSMDEVKQLLPCHSAIYYIGNGINTNKFISNNSIRNTNEIIIGYIGRIDPIKNLECLINAVSLLIETNHHRKKAIRLDLIGPQKNEHYRNKLIDLIINKNMQKIVTLSYATETIENYYNRLYVFVLPSFAEGTSNSLLEAMACERVCLVSKGADSDCLQENKFIFNPDNSEELSDKIEMAITISNEEYMKIGRSNRMKILNNYSLDALIKKYSKIWSEF
jgi:glycosyltransferase involved in cell wall biosynthesis